MRLRRPRITYANVVSTLALFIALSGVSYAAATLPKNSVGAKQLKSNAVTSKKIAKNAITGSKIKNGSLTGSDINPSGLGTVPSAAHASTADSAGTATNVSWADKPVLARVSASNTSAGSQDAARSAAPEVALASNGDVSVYGKCYVYSGEIYGDVLERTTQDGALAEVNDYSYYGGSGFLNSSTPENQRLAYSASTGNNAAYYTYYYNGIGSLFGPDGKGLQFDGQTWIKQGNLTPFGNGAYGNGDVCIFALHATKASL